MKEHSVGLAAGRADHRVGCQLVDSSRQPATSNSVRCRALVTLDIGDKHGMVYAFEEYGSQIMINVEFEKTRRGRFDTIW